MRVPSSSSANQQQQQQKLRPSGIGTGSVKITPYINNRRRPPPTLTSGTSTTAATSTTTPRTTPATPTLTTTSVENTRTTPPPNIFVDGFIVGNLNRNENDNNLVRNENTRPNLANWAWMDPDKQDALASIETEMIDKHTIEGVRPMFEFTFDDDVAEPSEILQDVHEEHDHHHEHGDHHDHGEHHGHGEHHMEGEHGIHEMHHHEHDHHGGAGGFHFPPLPADHQGLEETSQLNRAQRNFVGINNNLGLDMFKATLENEKHARENLVFSSLSATTSLALVFLGARGVTSWEINELLRLDEMISFNPHLMYKSVTDDFESSDAHDFSSACVKTLVVDKVFRFRNFAY